MRIERVPPEQVVAPRARCTLRRGRLQFGRCLWAGVMVALLLRPGEGWAEVQAVTQTGGPPSLPIPTWGETGLPTFTMPVGRPSSPLPPDPGLGGGNSSGGGGGTQADAVMESRSWGALAAQNASAIGVNPSAVAATCVLESGCQNIAAVGGSRISGAFQMYDPTYTAAIQRAAAQNPSLSGSIDTSLGGKMDPANQAIAAAQELKNAAGALQASGISNPTVLDTRGYYNFGAGYGVQIARASPDQLMSDLMPQYSAAQLRGNGIYPTTTVGQWRQSVSAKIGDAATQQVLI